MFALSNHLKQQIDFQLDQTLSLKDATKVLLEKDHVSSNLLTSWQQKSESPSTYVEKMITQLSPHTNTHTALSYQIIFQGSKYVLANHLIRQLHLSVCVTKEERYAIKSIQFSNFVYYEVYEMMVIIFK